MVAINIGERYLSFSRYKRFDLRL